MLRKLIADSIFVIREVKARFNNPIILCSGGKDSLTMLSLIRNSFFGEIPFPVVLLDTSYQFRETYDYMDKLSKAWSFNYIRAKNVDALREGCSVETEGRFKCCTKLKTDVLNNYIKENNVDAVLVGVRWDEHGVRGKESIFSIRHDPKHIRVHPLLNWSEKDVWQYIRKYNLPYNCLYDRVEHGNLVFRSIGCYPCTKPIPMESMSERAGRAQDKEEVMESLRALGYM